MYKTILHTYMACRKPFYTFIYDAFSLWLSSVMCGVWRVLADLEIKPPTFRSFFFHVPRNCSGRAYFPFDPGIDSSPGVHFKKTENGK